MSSKNKRLACVLLCLFIVLVAVQLLWLNKAHEIVWTAIDVAGDKQSGDAHLLQMPNGDNVLLDTGFKHYAHNSLLPALKERGVETIDLLLVSHGHQNHYGAIPVLLDEMTVDTVVFNLPPKVGCERETWGSGCSLEHVNATYDLIRQKADLKSVKQGDVVYNKDGVVIKALYYFSDDQEQWAAIGVNDASVVYQLTFGDSRVLFPGDIGKDVGEHLSQLDGADLSADAIVAPHHGVRATAPTAFYDKVNPSLVVVTVAGHLWEGKRGAQTRGYLQERNIPAYVTGIQGNIDLVISKESVSVR